MSDFQEDKRDWIPSKALLAKPENAGQSDGYHKSLLENPDEYDKYIKSLLSRLDHCIEGELDPKLQDQISRFIGLLLSMPRKVVVENHLIFEMAFEVLARKSPNTILARRLWVELVHVNNRSTFGMTWVVSYLAGITPLSATISALTTAVLLSFLLLEALLQGHQYLVNAAMPISVLDAHGTGNNGTLVCIAIHSATLGGIVSILSRMQKFVSLEDLSPTMVYISVLRKPFLAAAFVVLVFCVLQIGLINVPGISFDGDNAPYVAWAVGFLCGFSERFAQDVINSASSPFSSFAPYMSDGEPDRNRK